VLVIQSIEGNELEVVRTSPVENLLREFVSLSIDNIDSDVVVGSKTSDLAPEHEVLNVEQLVSKSLLES
jgi:hypothetical protein